MCSVVAHLAEPERKIHNSLNEAKFPTRPSPRNNHPIDVECGETNATASETLRSSREEGATPARVIKVWRGESYFKRHPGTEHFKSFEEPACP